MNIDYKITKEEHHWTSEEKLKFCGYGEWVEEPDVVEFKYLGYEAGVHRIFVREPYSQKVAYFGGHLCGYVKIPENHPYFGEEEIIIDCHGGLTFNEMHEEQWIGFDCAHAGDYVPTSEHMKKICPELIELAKKFPRPEGFKHFVIFNPVYRNVQFCIKECMDIITQLAGVSAK